MPIKTTSDRRILYGLIILIITLVFLLLFILKKIIKKRKLESIRLKEFSNDMFVYFGNCLTENSVLVNKSDPDYSSYTEIERTIPLKDHRDLKSLKHSISFREMISPIENLIIPADSNYGYILIFTWKYNHLKSLFETLDPPNFSLNFLDSYFACRFSREDALVHRSLINQRLVNKIFKNYDDVSMVEIDRIQDCKEFMSDYLFFN